MISMRRLAGGEIGSMSAGASTGRRPRSRSSCLSYARVEVCTSFAYTARAPPLPAAWLVCLPDRLLHSRPAKLDTSRGVEGLALRSPGNHRMSRREGANSRQMCGGGPSRSSHTVTGEETSEGSPMAVTHLECKECKAHYPLQALYVCERCFGPLEAVYEHQRDGRDVGELRRRIQGGPQNIWRYADFLPLAEGPPGPSGRLASRVGLPAGCTPLIRADRLAERLGLREVWVKNDAANPTHSFKDRVVSVAVSRARELGFDTIACASSGNLANSVAAHGAALGLESYVFIAADLEEQKVLATGIYGTHLVAVEGSYDDVNRLCTELCAEREWAFVNINLRPYYAEGSKTLAFEIAEQLGWELPDRCVVPVASGSLFTKVAKGFDEWRERGLLEGELPRMNRPQAAGCAPVADAFAAALGAGVGA